MLQIWKENPVCSKNHSGSNAFSWGDHMPCSGLCNPCFDPLWLLWTEYTDTNDISCVLSFSYHWTGTGHTASHTTDCSSSGIGICHVLCRKIKKQYRHYGCNGWNPFAFHGSEYSGSISYGKPVMALYSVQCPGNLEPSGLPPDTPVWKIFYPDAASANYICGSCSAAGGGRLQRI